MGKGVAEQFKKRFPATSELTPLWALACLTVIVGMISAGRFASRSNTVQPMK